MAEQLTPSELLALEISRDRYSWLDRANFHLDGLLEKAKRNNDIQWKMEKYYAMRNKVVKVKLK